MATTTSTLEPDPEIVPYEGLTQPDRNQSLAPIGEVRYRVKSGVITAGGVGNDQTAIVICDFPQNYAYAIADVFVRIFTLANDAANNFDDQGELQFTDSIDSGALENTSVIAPINSAGGTAAVQGLQTRKMYCLDKDCTPGIIMRPQNQVQAGLFVRFDNATDNDAQYGIDAFVRMYMYHTNQAFHWAPNSPQLDR